MTITGIVLIAFAVSEGCRAVVTQREFKKWTAENRNILTVEKECEDNRYLLEYHPSQNELYENYHAHQSGEKFTIFINTQSLQGRAKEFDRYARKHLPLQLKLRQGENAIRCVSAIPDTSFAHIGDYSAELIFDGVIQPSEDPIHVVLRDNYFGCAHAPLHFSFDKLKTNQIPIISNRPMP